MSAADEAIRRAKDPGRWDLDDTQNLLEQNVALREELGRVVEDDERCGTCGGTKEEPRQPSLGHRICEDTFHERNE